MRSPRDHLARLGLAALAGLTIATAPARSARAQAFADFQSLPPTFSANNQASSLTLGGSAQPVSFNFDSGNSAIFNQIATNYPSLTGPLNATVTYSGATTQAATAGGGTITQGFNGPVVIKFVLNSPVNGLSNLLTATISSGSEIVGVPGGNSASFLVASNGSPATITYTSDFFNTSTLGGAGVSIGFSGLSSGLAMGPGGFLSSFSSSQIGNFSATPSAAVPVPASLAMLASGLLGFPGIAVLRRRSTAPPAA